MNTVDMMDRARAPGNSEERNRRIRRYEESTGYLTDLLTNIYVFYSEYIVTEEGVSRRFPPGIEDIEEYLRNKLETLYKDIVIRGL